ncbi:hypothetical protein ACIHEI_01385 [Kitasatospora sp. NPDC051984]|uniref:hypothetical protein n=1 Tax=Kitasatospora sp. NPDC051984 TaxID=3364059 RepID=UPI0037C64E91
MAFTDETWRLVRGEELVGEIRITEADFPWLSGDFLPGPGWPAAEPGFAESLRLVEAEEWEAWDPFYTALTKNCTLHAPDGPVAEFLLHIEPPQAWFRFSEEPFEDD